MPIKCEQCDGAGWWSSGCDGQVKCRACAGTGYTKRGNCKPCRGTGYGSSEWNVDRPICDACHGTGSRAALP